MRPDEIFDTLFTGEPVLLDEGDRDPKLAGWAQNLHDACSKLPQFERLAAECRGDVFAAAMGTAALMDELAPHLQPQTPEAAPDGNVLRRAIRVDAEKGSKTIDDLREALAGLEGVGFGSAPGSGTGSGAGQMPVATVNAMLEVAKRLRSDERLRRIALMAGRFKRVLAEKRRSRVNHGADEITDIQQGADLARLLPSELVRLRHASGMGATVIGFGIGVEPDKLKPWCDTVFAVTDLNNIDGDALEAVMRPAEAAPAGEVTP